MLLAVLVLAALAQTPGQLAAQGEGALGPRPKSCWQGAPLPACDGFFLVELQEAFPLSVSSGHHDVFDTRFEWNLGYMANVSPDWAVGGAISLGTGASGAFTGLRARVRRWLGPRHSMEVQAGLVRTEVSGVGLAGHGISVDARLNVADQGSLFLRWDGVSVPRQGGGRSAYTAAPGGFGRAVYLGVGTGSTGALFATGMVALLYLTLLSAMGSS